MPMVSSSGPRVYISDSVGMLMKWARWACGSMPPGTTRRPVASMTSCASGGGALVCVSATILPSCTPTSQVSVASGPTTSPPRTSRSSMSGGDFTPDHLSRDPCVMLEYFSKHGSIGSLLKERPNECQRRPARLRLPDHRAQLLLQTPQGRPRLARTRLRLRDAHDHRGPRRRRQPDPRRNDHRLRGDLRRRGVERVGQEPEVRGWRQHPGDPRAARWRRRRSLRPGARGRRTNHPRARGSVLRRPHVYGGRSGRTCVELRQTDPPDVLGGHGPGRPRPGQDLTLSRPGSIEVDRTLAALADPYRRRAVDLLLERPRRAGELAEALQLPAPTMSRHLRVLRQTRLGEESHPDFDARGRIYGLQPEAIPALRAWLAATEDLWTDQ